MPFDMSTENTEFQPSCPVSEESCVKFNSDGLPNYFPGVTILSHFYQGIPIYDEIIKICAKADARRQIRHFIKLPEPSIHMTLCDVTTYDPLPGNLAVDKIRNSDVAKFMRTFHGLGAEIQQSLPIMMRLDLHPDRYPKEGRTLNLPLIPLDDLEQKKLNSIRQKLLSAFNRPFNSGYKFHITLYYSLRQLPEEEFLDLQEFWSESMRKMYQVVEIIPITRLELCTFDSMFHFKPAAVLEARNAPEWNP